MSSRVFKMRGWIVLLLLLGPSATGCSKGDLELEEVANAARRHRTTDRILISFDHGAIREEDGKIIARPAAPSVGGLLEWQHENKDGSSRPIAVTVDNMAQNAVFSIVQVESSAVTEGRFCSRVWQPVDCSETNQEGCKFQMKAAPGYLTRYEITGKLDPCTRVTFSIEPPQKDQSTIVVAANAPYRPLLDTLKTQAVTRKLDYVVLLGDFLGANATGEDVEGLTSYLKNYPYPVVLVAGTQEHRVTKAPGFIRRFGGGSYVYRYDGVWYLSYDAQEDGLRKESRRTLNTLLGGIVTKETEEYKYSPVVGLTYMPPLDPSGIGEGGFRNRWGGLSLLSMLSTSGVDLLLCGYNGAAGQSMYSGLELVVLGERLGGALLWLHIGRGLKEGRPMSANRVGENSPKYRVQVTQVNTKTTN